MKIFGMGAFEIFCLAIVMLVIALLVLGVIALVKFIVKK